MVDISFNPYKILKVVLGPSSGNAQTSAWEK